MIAAGFITLLVGGGLWYFQFMMGSQAIKQWEEDTKKAKEESKEFQAKIDEYILLKSREKEIMSRKAEVEKLAKRLPEVPEESQFYIILADIMDKANVFPIKVEKLKPNAREFYTEIPFRVECFVKYHNMGEFFNLIEEHPTRFMRIKQFNITDESPILQDRPSVQYASVEIATYSYNPRARLKPPKPAATPARAAAPRPAAKEKSEKME
ncbi:MAG: type 4a pilus biogenesis protein PilO [Candidatus Sumerlaeota bacterium]|nr:type 4a pilus biogenesis protein PilO [Candidatus Sumerlaeota bacterium]